MLRRFITPLLCTALGSVALGAGLASAQSPALVAVEPSPALVAVEPSPALVAVEVVVVRDGDVPSSSRIDAALARSLREVGGFTSVVFAALPLAELRLVVGCAHDDGPCLLGLTQALDATAIVVRRVRTNAHGTTLTLFYRDRASSDAPLTASRTGTPEHLTAAMSSLVRVLYGGAEPVVVASRRVRPWTWLTLGTGAALLVGGAVVGASASWGDYTTLVANTSTELDRVEASYAAAQNRALAGNVLLGAGALALGVGGALLVVDLFRSDSAPGADRLDLVLSPSLHGATLTLRSASRNFL